MAGWKGEVIEGKRGNISASAEPRGKMAVRAGLRRGGAGSNLWEAISMQEQFSATGNAGKSGHQGSGVDCPYCKSSLVLTRAITDFGERMATLLTRKRGYLCGMCGYSFRARDPRKLRQLPVPVKVVRQ